MALKVKAKKNEELKKEETKSHVTLTSGAYSISIPKEIIKKDKIKKNNKY